MEIIHLILGKANPNRMNGVNKVVNEMATRQFQAGYPVQVWGITSNPIHDYPERNFKTILFQSYSNPFKIDPELRAAFRNYAGNIVVHIHGAFLPTFYSATKLLHSLNIPYIITPHSTYNKVMMKKNGVIKKIYFRFFEKKLLDNAFCVHLLGKSEWEGLEAIYNNDKSVLIPYGFTKPATTATTFPNQQNFKVAYCGRMAIYPKGLDILIHGFSHFNKLYPTSQLILIGDGKDKSKLQQLSKDLGIEKAVDFTGGLFGNEKVNKLKECHVFAHPSRTDGLPATIVEAASLGIPCVVSDATNTGGFITKYDAGYFMEKLDAKEFSKGLQIMYKRIIEKNEGVKLQENSIRMITEAFDWELILKKFNEIYTSALMSSKDKNQISPIISMI
ncbi:MAG: glycosyltransferase [Chitinophagaceae bacterium]|nr:glycosyltransferase [Chitinophagaceae bacterium]